MRVGLITLFRNNYGSILQCYATKKFLYNNGIKCEVLSEKNEKRNWVSKIQQIIKIIYYSFRFKGYLYDKIKMRKAFNVEKFYLSDRTKAKMDDFVNREIRPIDVSIKELKEKQNNYDFFIIGSDQIWNASRELSDFFFLEFCNPNKKIAFGPSIGIDKIPLFNKKIEKKINSFNKLSLREETAVKIIRRFYKGPIIRVGDPTLLLDSKEWRNFCCKCNRIIDDYVLVHFLNLPSKKAMYDIKLYTDSNDLNIVIIGNKYDVYDSLHKFYHMDASPEEYVSLIDGAKAVFTDSFHSSLFSINLNSNFYCYERQYLHGKPQTSRITDMLNRYGYAERFIEESKSILDIDSKVTNSNIESDRVIVRRYLLSELGRLDYE